jgi:3D (Asp-Asp-Asp) domain-containing protein/LysM repeat protein
MIALVGVGMAASAFPLTGPSADSEDRSDTPVLVVADGLSAALHAQAETVVNALTQGGPAPTPTALAFAQSPDGFPGAALLPRPLLEAAAHILVRGALAGPEGQQGLVMDMGPPVRFTIHWGRFSSQVFSTRPTVGSALNALGAEYGPQEAVWPPPETPLTAGLHIFLVERATGIALSAGGDEPEPEKGAAPEAEPAPEPQPIFTVYTVQPGDSVASIADSFGIDMEYVLWNNPDLHENPDLLQVGQELQIPIVNGLIYNVKSGDTLSDIASFYQIDVQSILAFAPNGITSADTVIEGMVLLLPDAVPPPPPPPPAAPSPPTPAVDTTVAAPVAEPEGDLNCARTMNVWATWYTAASAGGSGTTATGTTVRKGTVAVDPSVIPLGTRMYIPGYGYGVAEDTGGAIIGNIIDLGYGPNDVMDWRSGWVEICILSAGG